MKKLVSALLMFAGLFLQGAAAHAPQVKNAAGQHNPGITPVDAAAANEQQERSVLENRLQGLGYFQ